MALRDRFPPDRAARVYAGFLTFADPNVFCTTLLGRFLVDRPLFYFGLTRVGKMTRIL